MGVATINPVIAACRGSSQVQGFVFVIVNDLKIGAGAEQHGVLIDIPQFRLETIRLLYARIVGQRHVNALHAFDGGCFQIQDARQ